MKLNEIISLIEIKNYAFNIINSNHSSKEHVKYMSNIMLLIDKKIGELLSNEEFKKYIGYEHVDDLIKEVRNISNIKSGLK